MNFIKPSAIRAKMKKKPVGQRIHLFFKGAVKLLTIDQIDEVERLVIEEHTELLKFLSEAKNIVKPTK